MWGGIRCVCCGDHVMCEGDEELRWCWCRRVSDLFIVFMYLALPHIA